MEEYDYFMIRVLRPPAGGIGPTCSGVVERLATGEKQGFTSGEELLRVVGGDPGRLVKMQRPVRFGNPPRTGPST